MKIVFCAYLREKWIGLRQTNTKMITGPSYRYRRIHFTCRNAPFVHYSSVCLSVTYFTYLLLTQHINVVECLCFRGKLPFKLVNGGIFVKMEKNYVTKSLAHSIHIVEYSLPVEMLRFRVFVYLSLCHIPHIPVI